LIKQSEKNIYKYGLLTTSNLEVGIPRSLQDIDNTTENKSNSWALFGVPIDFHPNEFSNLNSGDGVEAIRNSLRMFSETNSIKKHRIYDLNRNKSYQIEDVLPYDFGNLVYNDKFETIYDFSLKLQYIIDKIKDLKLRPLVLGGDHSISYYILKKLIDSDSLVNVVHLDAHSDSYQFQHSQLTNGNVITHIKDLQCVNQVYQFGVREFEVLESDLSNTKTICSSVDLENKPVEQLIKYIDKDLPLYLTVDADIYDPTIAPEVSYPVMGGPSYYKIFELVDKISQNFNVIGADFVEVCGPESGRNYAASCIGNLITLLLLNQRGNKNEAYS